MGKSSEAFHCIVDNRRIIATVVFMISEAKTLRIAVAQPYTKLGDIEGNLAQVLDLASQAALNGCEIVLFPECALYGYSVPPEVLAKAEPADGRIAESLRAHAQREGIVIAAGVFERVEEDEGVCISHFVAFPDGELLVQRKAGGHESDGLGSRHAGHNASPPRRQPFIERTKL